MQTRARRGIRLYPVPASSKEARKWMEAMLKAAGRPEWVENSIVITSELVTNATRHTGRPFVLVYSEFDDLPWIEVHDQSSAPPDWHVRGGAGESGRGLRIVAVLSAVCGHSLCVDPLGGKIVYSCPLRDDETPTGDSPLSGPELHLA